MALTVTNDFPVAERLSRNVIMMTGSIAFDASYPTGGEALIAATLKLRSILSVQVEAQEGYVFYWTGDKLLAYTAGSQVADTTDLSGITSATFVAVGLK